MTFATRRAILGWLMAIAAMPMPAATPAAAQTQPPLTVFAAASLTNALTEIGKAYTAKTGQPVRFSFASSGVIARQIEAGAKADLFFSADTEWMDYVQTRGLIDPSTRRDLLRGRLALIAPAASTVRLTIKPGFALAAALGAKGRLSTGDPDSVPAGRYARAALTSLGVWPTVADRLVRADNVRTALTYVAHGEAPLGIVYETDAAIEPGVRIVGFFPEASHAPIVYPVAITKTAAPGSADFYRFATGPAARAIYAKYKFQPIGR
ncbi:molybdate ABC transporter substrate-binding protein [uncultured Sphingomonas sp.]|uniref:molybdate ABC transporter substrate-binding protein n=1 Tax=uncultured Sphingomonas sp. TaxID=158754 RepID=UPI0035CB6F21